MPGGKRTGAGRPPDPAAKKMVSLRLDRKVIAYLETTENKTVAVETAVQKTKGYRTWKANHKEKTQ